MIARPSTRSLLLAGTAGPIVFIATVLFQDMTRPGYDPLRQFISVLSLGDEGWLQAANFIVSGVLIAGFGVGLWRVAGGAPVRGIAVLLVVTGSALAASGLFPPDPQLGYPYWISVEEVRNPTLHSRIHFLGGFVATAAFSLAIGVAAWHSLCEGARRRAAYGLASVTVMLGCFLIGLVNESPSGSTDWGGLLQRIGLVAGLQWLVQLGWAASRRQESSRRAGANP